MMAGTQVEQARTAVAIVFEVLVAALVCDVPVHGQVDQIEQQHVRARHRADEQEPGGEASS